MRVFTFSLITLYKTGLCVQYEAMDHRRLLFVIFYHHPVISGIIHLHCFSVVELEDCLSDPLCCLFWC